MQAIGQVPDGLAADVLERFLREARPQRVGEEIAAVRQHVLAIDEIWRDGLEIVRSPVSAEHGIMAFQDAIVAGDARAVEASPRRALLLEVLHQIDAEFVFPGQHSFAADLHSRPPIEQWIRRFAALRPDYEITDVVVGGPPWNTRIALRFRDRIGSDYENEGMQYMKLRWGRVVHERIFLDTQKIAERGVSNKDYKKEIDWGTRPEGERLLRAGVTGFRNGEENLHFKHVNKIDKGRTCRACHDFHASPNPKHIKTQTKFGNWEFKLNYQKTETGGSCWPGCHVQRKYDRAVKQENPR